MYKNCITGQCTGYYTTDSDPTKLRSRLHNLQNLHHQSARWILYSRTRSNQVAIYEDMKLNYTQTSVSAAGCNTQRSHKVESSTKTGDHFKPYNVSRTHCASLQLFYSLNGGYKAGTDTRQEGTGGCGMQARFSEWSSGNLYIKTGSGVIGKACFCAGRSCNKV